MSTMQNSHIEPFRHPDYTFFLVGDELSIIASCQYLMLKLYCVNKTKGEQLVPFIVQGFYEIAKLKLDFLKVGKRS